MAETQTTTRQSAVSDLKRSLILDAAREIFEHEGIEGASIRAIAKRAGYTPGALYFHFQSKEDVYGALLDGSLDNLVAQVTAAVTNESDPGRRLRKAGHAFFDFYLENPRDLDLGFYLFRGGMRPEGLGGEQDRALNEKLLWALAPFRHALQDMGCDEEVADAETAAFFAHSSGLLLLEHTGRMTLFAAGVEKQLDAYLYDLEHRIGRAIAVAEWQKVRDDD